MVILIADMANLCCIIAFVGYNPDVIVCTAVFKLVLCSYLLKICHCEHIKYISRHWLVCLV